MTLVNNIGVAMIAVRKMIPKDIVLYHLYIVILALWNITLWFLLLFRALLLIACKSPTSWIHGYLGKHVCLPIHLVQSINLEQPLFGLGIEFLIVFNVCLMLHFSSNVNCYFTMEGFILLHGIEEDFLYWTLRFEALQLHFNSLFWNSNNYVQIQHFYYCISVLDVNGIKRGYNTDMAGICTTAGAWIVLLWGSCTHHPCKMQIAHQYMNPFFFIDCNVIFWKVLGNSSIFFPLLYLCIYLCPPWHVRICLW